MPGDAKKPDCFDLLAKAMKEAFQEGIQSAFEPVRDDLKGIKTSLCGVTKGVRGDMKEVRSDMKGMEARLNNDMKGMEARLSDGIDTISLNMEAHFATQEEEIGKMLTNIER